MMDEELEDRGYTPAQIAELTALFEAQLEQALAERALPYAGELLHRIFVRVDRDSVAGRALARALGATNDQSLERAARDFGVSKQYLHRLEQQLRARLHGIASDGARQ